MKKALSLVLALGMAVSTMSAPALAEEGGEFNIRACIASEPETIDPNLENTVDAAVYSMHLFEGLMKYTNNGEPAAEGDDRVQLMDYDYGVAESYDVSDDDLVYTFHLRDEAVWSDGEPVTAQDFVYSWQRIVNPETAATYGYILNGVVKNASAIQAGEMEPSELGVVAIDDKTLEVTLETECPYFIGLCAFAALMPLRQDVIEEYGTEWTTPGNMVSNGAFVLTDWQHDNYIEMSRNDQYYDPAGPDKITWYLSDSQSAQLAAYEAGEYDFFYDVPTDQISTMKDAGQLFTADQICTYYLHLHCDNIPDWRVRAAIALSIDRENIVENVTQAGQTPATGVVAAGITDSEGTNWVDRVGDIMWQPLAEMYPDADLTTYSGRCDLAVQLLDEAVAEGYDTSATMTYEYNTSEAHKAIAEAVQADVANVLGLEITLHNSEWQTYQDNLNEGEFGLGRMAWSADYNDAITYIEMFTNGNSYNYSNWVSDEYTALVEEIKSLPGGEERDALMQEAEAMLFSEGGFSITPLYFYVQPYCLQGEISNVGWTPLGYFSFIHATQGAAE